MTTEQIWLIIPFIILGILFITTEIGFLIYKKHKDLKCNKFITESNKKNIKLNENRIEQLELKLNKASCNINLLIKYINFMQLDIKQIITNKNIYNEYKNKIKSTLVSIIKYGDDNSIKELLQEANIKKVEVILNQFEEYKAKQEEFDKYNKNQ